eukprot:Hpha_TRINITY_DN16506_c0_g1::TRINITY_DN16506_c0_g1_i1::g.132576::m.132576/K01279/TPP1, CLN2; tripeptidyl-peptidase I
MELLFAVKQQGVPALERALFEVSDPRSPRYGKHLSQKEVHDLVAPRGEHIEVVRAFLASHGLEAEAATPNSDMLRVVVPVTTAEALLEAEYIEVHHAARGLSLHRTLAYSLPEEVAAAVDFVAPTVHIPDILTTPSLATDTGSMWNTPTTLRDYYNVGDAAGSFTSGNKQAVTAFLGQFYAEGSLKKYQELYCKDIPSCGKGTVETVGDAINGSSPGTESMLDIELITTVGPGVQSAFWGFSGNANGSTSNEPFLQWLAVADSTPDADIPKVFSTSYGEAESSTPIDMAVRMNTEFMKLGARGVSVIFASGDGGAGGIKPGYPCAKGNKFKPTFPASSPYVTAVGGTQPAAANETGQESAVFLSSGGFSNRWSRPQWQTDAVAHYLKQSGLPDPSHYNTSLSRAFPDVSSEAINFVIVTGGLPLPGISGTSCAAPTVGGLIGLLNEERVKAGKATLGFLNPFIYQHMADFHDIVSGSSKGCLTALAGWPAKPGWDAVTGVGTLNFAKLSTDTANLP